jgi:membrane protease YdiL (CAAX protease family)
MILLVPAAAVCASERPAARARPTGPTRPADAEQALWKKVRQDVLGLLGRGDPEAARERLLEYLFRKSNITREEGETYTQMVANWWEFLPETDPEDLSRLRALAAEHPGWPVLAEAAAVAGGTERAGPALEKLCTGGRGSWWTWYLLGLTRRKPGPAKAEFTATPGSLEAWRRCVELKPDCLRAWRHLAYDSRQLGRDREYLEAIRRYLELETDPGQAAHHRDQLIRFLLDRQQLGEAFAEMKRAGVLFKVLAVIIAMLGIPLVLVAGAAVLVVWRLRRRRAAAGSAHGPELGQGAAALAAEPPGYAPAEAPASGAAARFEWWHGLVAAGLFFVLGNLAGVAAVLFGGTGPERLLRVLATAAIADWLLVLAVGWLAWKLCGSARAGLALDFRLAPGVYLWGVGAVLAVFGVSVVHDLVLQLFGLHFEQHLVGLLRGLSGFWPWLAVMGLGGVVIPVAEEVVFRGCLYPALRRPLGTAGAAALSALVFAAMHLELGALVPIFFIGVVLALFRERTGSLAAPIFVHVLNNLLSFSFILLFPTGG